MTRVAFTYKNHNGEVAERTIEATSLDLVPMPNNRYGYGPGWFLTGYDFTGERKGEQVRSFALCNIQIPEEEFRRMTNNHPFRIDLTSPELKAYLADELRKAGHDVPAMPVERGIPEVVLNSETGNEPVPSHGGGAQLVRWELFVNGVKIDGEDARFPWDFNPAKRELNTRIDKAPFGIKSLFDNLSKAFGTPNPPVEDYKYTSNEHAADSLAYLMEAGNRAFERSGIAENFREPGEFGDGATVKAATPVDATKPDLGTTVLPIARSAVDEILKK